MILIEKIGDEIHEHFTDDNSLFPNAIPYDENNLPDDSFRNAWDLKNNKVMIDLPKAQVITKERLRIERKPLLEAEDVKFMQAQESGSDTKAIVAEKQRLRDITKSVDTCKTTDELKALSCTEENE